MAKGHRSQIKKERNAIKDTRPKAHGKFLRISDTKARIVLEQIKGKDVGIAVAVLQQSPRYASYLIEKILRSAVANAENNMGIDQQKLYVQEAIANKGASAGSRFRLRARAKGRGDRIERKFSHISIVLNVRS